MTDETRAPQDPDNHDAPAEDWRVVWRQMTQEMAVVNNDHARLTQRAKTYAQPIAHADDLSDDESYQVLCFSLGEEKYALDIMLVRSVRLADNITRVPGIPPFFPGVINVRGQIITVFDLRHWYGNNASHVPAEAIIIEANGLHLAVLADRIEQVTRIAHAQVISLDLQYARGVTTDRRVVLDMANLCADERLRIGHREDPL